MTEQPEENHNLLCKNIAAFFAAEQWDEYPNHFLRSVVGRLVDVVEYGEVIPEKGIRKDRFEAILPELEGS